MILSFGLDKICARSKEKVAGTRKREGAGAAAQTGARAGAGAGVTEMSDHLAVLKPRSMIDIIIWSCQDMCNEQGAMNRRRSRSRSRRKNKSKSRRRF